MKGSDNGAELAVVSRSYEFLPEISRAVEEICNQTASLTRKCRYVITGLAIQVSLSALLRRSLWTEVVESDAS